ncbi:MAG: hypothetical protein VCB99_00365 [Myxococcota bacterium]
MVLSEPNMSNGKNKKNTNENESTTTTATAVVACVTGNNLHAVIGTVGTEDTTSQVCLGSAAVALGFFMGGS